MKYDRYRKFRQQTYQMLGRAKDATFELMDSVMTTRNVSCLAELSLSPLFRRKWSSTYEALEDSRPNRNKLIEKVHRRNAIIRICVVGNRPHGMGKKRRKNFKR